MNFLFEIQYKKPKVTTPVKKPSLAGKKISMDVRAPEHPLPYALKTSHVDIRQRTTPKTHTGARWSANTAPRSLAPISYYAERVSEITVSRQAPKRREWPGLVLATVGSILLAVASWMRDALSRSLPQFTPNKLVYGSIMSGVAFGMVSLGLIEKTFESNANASEEGEIQKVETVMLETENYNPEKDVFMQYFSDAADAEYQAGVRELVKGHPIEEMLPYIFEKDRITAAFLIGIAKKESNWGKRVPVLEGQDCFNYWGYRGQRRLMGSGGHTCFNSRKDAVDTVAKRLETLINSERLNTPEKLIVWKCGMSCEGHSRESVQKWISDVDAYYSEMMALESQNTELEDAEGDSQS